MERIKITEEEYKMLLPDNIKNSDVISANAKKLLATILNYYRTSPIVKETGYLVCPNDVMRQSVGIKKNNMLKARDELICYELINVEAGKKWKAGQDKVATKYTVRWENIKKELKRKGFDDIFSTYLDVPKTEAGPITITYTNTITSTNTNSYTNANAATNTPHYTEPLIDKNLCTVVNNASNKNKCSNIEPHYKEPNTGNTYVNYGYNEPLCKEPNIGNKEIEQQENKGAANAALHAIEIKINEMKKRYYTIEDLDELEDNLYTYIDKFNLEGKEELRSYVQNSIGNMRCDLMFGSSMVCESIEGVTVTKVF